MSKRARIGVLAVSVLTVAVVVFFATRKGSSSPPDRAEPVVVRVVRVERSTSYAEQRTHVGRAAARRVSAVGSELGGLVTAVLVDEGQEVAAGQELARTDVLRLRANRARLVADAERARAVLAELRAGPRGEDIAAQEAEVRRLEAAATLQAATAKRVRSSYESSAVSAREWDEARLGAEQAEAAAAAAAAVLAELRAGSRKERVAAQEAAVRALDAGIAAIDVDIAKAAVRAPFHGRVSRRFADEGVVLAPGAPVLELREVAAAESADGTLEIRVGLVPDLAHDLAVGREVRIAYRGHEDVARVIALRRDRSPRTRTVTALLRASEAAEPERRLRDGELVQVRFDREIEVAGFWLPLGALSEGVRGLWRCFVLEPVPERSGTADLRLAVRTVEVVRFDEERAYVRGGLAAGMEVVAAGTHRLVPGMVVRRATEQPR